MFKSETYRSSQIVVTSKVNFLCAHNSHSNDVTLHGKQVLIKKKIQNVLPTHYYQLQILSLGESMYKMVKLD